MRFDMSSRVGVEETRIVLEHLGRNWLCTDMQYVAEQSKALRGVLNSNSANTILSNDCETQWVFKESQ